MDINYCPFCGKKLEVDETICSKCGKEIKFDRDGGIDTDNLEGAFLERYAPKFGRILVVLAFISLFLCNFFTYVAGAYAHPLAVMATMLGASIAMIVIVLSFVINYRLKKNNFRSLGPCNAAIWISTLGLALFLLFFIVAIFLDKIVPPASSSESVALLISLII